MRNIFLALVLANLAFAAWHAWFAAPPAGRSVNPESDRLPLVGEIDDELRRGPDETLSDRDSDQGPPRSDPPGASPAPIRLPTAGLPGMDVAPTISLPALDPGADTPEPGADTLEPRADSPETPALAGAQANPRRCVSLGPFREETEASAAMQTLRAAGHAPSRRDAEGPAVIDYWVHLAEIPSRAEANEMLARLRDNGVDDSYLIPGEEDGDIISLGVFRQTYRAERLQDEVRQIGFESIVAELTRRPTIRWIDVEMEAGVPLELESLQTPGRPPLEQQACPSSGL